MFEGVSFKPELCLNGTLLELCPTEPVTKTITPGDGPVTVPTYGIWQGDVCSTNAGRDVFEETSARVFRALDVNTSYKTEQALWDGLGTITDSSALASTAADDINGGAVVGVTTGMSDMIAALNAVLGGARGVIHVAQQLVPILDFYGLVFRNGNILQVPGTDHVIVAGTGYSGNGPDGAAPLAGETWIYGTGPVNVLLSSIQVVPEFPAEAIDRSTNSVEVRAERAVAAYFNPCAHIAVNVCLTEPGPCGGS
jgi:hypothetical protein